MHKCPLLILFFVLLVPLNGPEDVVTNIAGERQELVNISWQVRNSSMLQKNKSNFLTIAYLVEGLRLIIIHNP